MVQSDKSKPTAIKRRPGRPKGSVNKVSALRKGTQVALRTRLKEQKQSVVQEEILQAAAQLIAARGFRAVTIDDISTSLGFTKSVVYYYLKSKNDILWRIFARMYESYFDSLSQIAGKIADPDTKLYEIIRQHALNVMSNRDWTAIYFKEEAELDEKQQQQIAKKKRQYDATIEAIYREGVSLGMFRDIPSHLAVTGLLGSCNWIYTWYNPDGPMSASNIADHYATLLANGFRVAERTPSAPRLDEEQDA